MNEVSEASRSASRPPEAVVAKRRGISIVWIVPLVAAAIGAFLAYRAYTERGPTVTITFDTAEGLEAGKTKVRYLDVEVGTVGAVAIGPDLRHIVVTAEMVPGASEYLREGTRFWIVKPRIGVGGVSGLSTLLSGAYIGLEPGDGEPARSFAGLEDPPPISSNVPGREYVLTASNLGSVSQGAPITYRGVDVGQVLGYKLTEDARALDVTIFVEEPYHQLVRSASRFWNTSGIDIRAGTAGFDVHVASLQALLVGGIAFDTPLGAEASEVAAAGATFPLFASEQAVAQAQYTEKIPYLVYFDGSVRGLSPGAPVEFRGLRVGSVTGVRLDFDPTTNRIRIPVTLEIEPQRLVAYDPERLIETENHRTMIELVRRGLRAQLQTGNLLTGELIVDLTFVQNAAPAELDTSGPVPVIPSVPNTLDQLQASVTEILNKVAGLPVEELVASVTRTVKGVEDIVTAPGVQEAVRSLGSSMARLQETIGRVDANSGPVLASLKTAADSASATLRQAETTLASVQRTIGPASGLTSDAASLIQELTRAARSIRVFADYLDRHPEALIRGKAGASGR
ncbi:MAG TPA: MlaD family protein [Geminicoccaceae bacterium]|jgi:paraquat-inducible protein B|nr:MlaD family protein [Geminicoccaceae bacterium]